MGISDEPYVPMAKAEKMAGHIAGPTRFVGVNQVSFGHRPEVEDVIAGCDIGQTLVLEQLDETPRVRAGNHDGANRIAAFKDFGKVKPVPVRIERVVERKENDVPTLRGAIAFGAAQDAGMEGMEHDSIAEKKGQRPGLVALQQIEIELRSRIKNRHLNGWIDTVVSVQNPRHRRNTDLGLCRDLFEADPTSL